MSEELVHFIFVQLLCFKDIEYGIKGPRSHEVRKGESSSVSFVKKHLCVVL